jgi:D-lactate dehydrogenase
MTARLAPMLDLAHSGTVIETTQRSIDRFAMAHDASHYLLVPDLVATPRSTEEIATLFRASASSGRPITFRSGGTSLSGQGVTASILVDTRRYFQKVRVLDGGARIRLDPGVTVRQANAHLVRHGRKLGPDPASEIACTIGGVVANNSSGMACGIEQNSYRTLESMIFVLPSGTVVDTAAPDAEARLLTLEPDLYAGLLALRDRVRSRAESVIDIRRQYSMKNTMGYGVNSFLDFDTPVAILEHLIIGSEGTLAFVSEATFRTVEVKPFAATGLLVFPTLSDATAALPALVETGLATIELMDAQSLRVAQLPADAPRQIAALTVTGQAAFLVEFQASDDAELTRLIADAGPTLESVAPGFTLTTDAAERAALWHTRKGLFTTVAGARPSGTTALLEDIVVPVAELLSTCEGLTALFDEHGYEGSVIFGHAKDGNIHFMLNERFDDPQQLLRYERFTEAMVELVLRHGGSLKAEHGTGRIMAPFVERQFGAELYGVMREVKRLCDPNGMLNPGVLLSDDATSHLTDLKVTAGVESEVDRCVECGYCEPGCPSRNLTMTPRQRIVVRRELAAATARGDADLVSELTADYEYDGVETCAVDGMCAVACPVDINTGDLVRRLRAESRGALEQKAWKSAAANWGALTALGGRALSVAHALPLPLTSAATRVGRAVLGDDTVPLYSGDLPRGGTRRRSAGSDTPDAVFFAACIGTMFGPAAGGIGSAAAFEALCRRAGVVLTIPDGIQSLCCGTPWKSKGYTAGSDRMRDEVMPALLVASRGGQLPIVCDAASCTEGLETMQRSAASAGPEFAALRFVDSVEFVRERVLDSLALSAPVASVAVHHTCSTTQLGENEALTAIARFVSPDVHVPVDWGCCAFAGDRGLLHPELTASATRPEADELATREFAAYVSANRTCELGMSRATGHEYRHVLEVLEEATR